MKKVAFFDSKQYDIISFNNFNQNYQFRYFEEKLSINTVDLTIGYDAVCVFVNDTVDAEVINKLVENGVKLIALRCAGFNNIDLEKASGKITIVRVPAYSPHAVAEHAMALLLSLNRKIHKAYTRTRDFNFSLTGLTGFDMFGKTIGVIGTGRIGQIFIKIAKGFGMNVIAYDLYPNYNLDVNYVSLDDLLKQSDMISVHIPLTDQTKYLINDTTIAKMKDGMYLVNTSRGGVIDTQALIRGLKCGKIKAAGLDVYEEESSLFFEDMSDTIIQDDVLSILVNLPNVILTSHQAFLTEEALGNIAEVTIQNLDNFFANKEIVNEVCWKCKN